MVFLFVLTGEGLQEAWKESGTVSEKAAGGIYLAFHKTCLHKIPVSIIRFLYPRGVGLNQHVLCFWELCGGFLCHVNFYPVNLYMGQYPAKSPLWYFQIFQEKQKKSNARIEMYGLL